MTELSLWVPVNSPQFLAASLVGLLSSFVSQRAKGLIDVPLYEYLFINRPGRTLATVLSLVAATFAAAAVGGLEEMKMTTALASGFTSGWVLDAGVNNGLAKRLPPGTYEDT